MSIVVFVLLSAIATAATVKVLLSGTIFDTPRLFIYARVGESTFLGKLIRCPYCLSFWVSACILAAYFISMKVWLFYVVWLSIQRMSNLFDDIVDKIYYGQYGPHGLDFSNSASDSKQENKG